VLSSPRSASLRVDEYLFLLGVALTPIMRPDVWVGAFVIPADFVFASATLAFAISLARGRARIFPSRFYWFLSAYFGAVLLSAIASAERRASIAKAGIDLYLLLLAGLALNQAHGLAGFRRMLRAWLVGSTVTALAALLGVIGFYIRIRGPLMNVLLGTYGGLPPGNYPRVTGLFLNFNMLCNFLSISVLLVFLARRAGWLSARASQLLVGLFLVAAIFTVSPGLGGLGLGVCLWLAVDARDRHKAWRARLWCSVGLVIAAGFLFASAFVPAKWSSPAQSTYELAPSGRLNCWQAAMRTFADHPLLGLGTGLPMHCPDYQVPAGEVQQLEDAHNLYLNIAALKGGLGLAAFLALAFYLMRGTVWRFEPNALAVQATLAIAFVQAVLYQGLTGSFEHTRHLWLLMGALAAWKGKSKRLEAEA